jgi:CHAT domain-containing protein
VPDGKLSLIPFAALMDGGEYVVTSHVVSSIPSSIVLHLIRSRKKGTAEASIPLVGVAAWTGKNETLLKRVLRSVEGPKRSEFDTLPESRREVESVAADLPKPSTILLGSSATETRFKQLPLNQYNVLHLALHGYADLDYPDRSALAFAPEKNGADDGLLQVREIRHLGLNASLVTLSACNTGVGPVGQTCVANIANAFIEAGAQSVIATLWELEDRATIQLMSNFYTHLGHGMKKGEALRQAQLELLYSGQPPFYWASFEIVGEPDDALVHLNDLGSANNQPKGPEWSSSQKQ